MPTKTLYHGSPRKIEGELAPNKARDLEKKIENQQNAIYATEIKEFAIIMAILKSKGVGGSSMDFETGKSKIYRGWPEQETIYIHHLPADGFEQTPSSPHQFISKTPVNPIRVEELKIEDYMFLIKKASRKETKEWQGKYNLQ